MKTSLQGKTIVLIILIAVVIGASGLIVSSRFINDLIDDTYKSKANDIAHTMAVVIDANDAAHLQDEVRSIFADTEEKVSSEEWGSEAFNAYIGRFAQLEETKEFQNLQHQLRLIQDENDVDCLYLSIVDGPTVSMIYLVDGAYEDACPPGCFDPLYEENQELLVNPERGFPPYITNTEPYGWLVTAGAPVHDSEGNVICYAMADIPMGVVRDKQQHFSMMLALGLAGLTVLICFVGIMVVNRMIIRPINKLSSAAAHYSQDNQTELNELTIKTKDEIQSLYTSIKQMTQDINRYIDNLMKTTDELTRTKEKANEMDALAHKDSLTGVGSKLAYDQKVKQLSEDIANGNAEFGIIMVDLNYLKQLNDNFGHEKGNEAIQKTCQIICDVFKHSPVYRIGGDEFAVIVQDRDYENIDTLVEEFNNSVKSTKGAPWEKISAAIGYARYEKDYTVEDVFRRADKNMYERKKEMKKENC